MNIKPSNIVRKAMAVLLPLLITVNSTAQRIVYEGDKTKLEITQIPGQNYRWEIYNTPLTNFAISPGNCPTTAAKFISGNTGPSVNVEWMEPGTYFYKVTAWNSLQCSDNFKMGTVKVVSIDIQAVITGPMITGGCQPIILDGSLSKGVINSYEWSLQGNGATLSKTNEKTTQLILSPSVVLPAEFKINLKVTGLNGKTDDQNYQIKMASLPVAEISSNNIPSKDGSIKVDGSASNGSGLNYHWSTMNGRILGSADQPLATLLGSGIYTLVVTDTYGCTASKSYRFPTELYQIAAKPDYIRTSWSEDTTVYVLNNDKATAPLIPGSVRVIQAPQHGQTKVNSDGSVTYIPGERISGRDQFIYEVCDAVNLCDSAMVTVDVYDAKVELTEAFSPNGDGINEFLVFKGLEKYPGTRLHVYTRAGQLVYSSNDYQNDWDGRTSQGSSNNLVPTGVYYYILELGGTNTNVKGFVYIAY